MVNNKGRSGGQYPPDNYEGAVKWIYDDARGSKLTIAWDRLICRPKAYKLRITGVESSKAPDRDEFLRTARELHSPRQDIEVHFLARGVQWGWRYDKGLLEVDRGSSIELVDVVTKNEWIASRTDTAEWKRRPEDEQRNLRMRIKELEKQLREGTWQQSGAMRTSTGVQAKNDGYRQVQTECIKCFQKIGVAAEFTKNGNIIKCMKEKVSADWPEDWLDYVVKNAGNIIEGVEIEK